MLSARLRRSFVLVPLLLAACSGPDTTPAPLPPPVHAQMKAWDPDTGGEFFASPWPDDRRLDENGRVPLEDVPNPGAGGLFDTMLQHTSKMLKGWGLNSPIYLPLSGAIDPATLPQTPTKDANASVFLMVVDPTSPYLGQHTYIDFKFFDTKTLFLPANVLATRPVPGFPLEPRTKYALVVTNAVKDTVGQPLVPDATFQAILDGTAPEQEKTLYQPLFDELAKQSIPRTNVAAAIVFTTQPLFEEILAIRDYLLTFDAPAPAMDMSTLKVITDEEDLKRIWRGSKPSTTMWVLQGSYKAPYMQHGTRPFLTEGGNFEFDGQGKPVPAFIEDMRVTICLPTMTPPTEGFPAVFYSHGTGGNFEHAVADICPDLADKGMIVFGIDQVLSGPRAGGGTSCFGQPVEECFFNYANPVAARTNVQQAALDHISLRRMAASLVIPASLHPNGVEAKVDGSKLGFFGHSQGGLTGALYSAIDPDLWGSVLSGAGGHLTTTILQRSDPDAKALAEGPFFLNIAGQESLEPYHPALAVAQMLVDVADPINYARYWFRRPNGRPKHIYATSGLLDPYTVADTAEDMAAAAGLPQLIPIGRKSDIFTLAELKAIAPPVKLNASTSDGTAKVTAVFRQFPKAGHYPVFDDKTARTQWTTFFETMFATGEPTVPRPTQ